MFNTILLFNIAMENGPCIDDFPSKTSIYNGFSIAMLNTQMVAMLNYHPFHIIVRWETPKRNGKF